MKDVKAKKTMARLDPTTKRRSGNPCVHYLVEWAGAQWVGHDTWEPVDQLQGIHVKGLINAFNVKLRAAQAKAPAVAKGCAAVRGSL